MVPIFQQEAAARQAVAALGTVQASDEGHGIAQRLLGSTKNLLTVFWVYLSSTLVGNRDSRTQEREVHVCKKIPDQNFSRADVSGLFPIGLFGK
jgi:hypothetical protein